MQDCKESPDKRISSLLSKNNVARHFLDDMRKQGLPLETPCLQLELKSQDALVDLDAQDIKQVFQVFGQVTQVKIVCFGQALVVFQDPVPAYFAWKSLNGKELEGIGVTLKVDWYFVDKENQKPMLASSKKPQECYNQQKIMPFTQTQPQPLISPLKASAKEFTALLPKNDRLILGQMQTNVIPPAPEVTIDSRPSAKFTCRYHIPIDNDNDFQISKRIIGSRGCNMKRIVQICSSSLPVEDMIKLRLRGRGSGFKEGQLNQESNDPLHLCVSARYWDKYLMACQECEMLLLRIYQEYKTFCRQRGVISPPLQIIKQENPTQNVCVKDVAEMGWSECAPMPYWEDQEYMGYMSEMQNFYHY